MSYQNYVIAAYAIFAIVLAWSVVTRPREVPQRRFALSHSMVREGEQVLVVAAIEPVEGAEVLSAAVSPAPYVEGVVQEKVRAVRDLEGVEMERTCAVVDASGQTVDGLRRVPDNIPNKEMVAEHLGKPLTSIPDPFGTHESFGHH